MLSHRYNNIIYYDILLTAEMKAQAWVSIYILIILYNKENNQLDSTIDNLLTFQS